MSINSAVDSGGIISWFAKNTVATNLLMIFLLVGGLLSLSTIRKQMFPVGDLNTVIVTAVYPGAAPQEVEEGITIKVENALEGLPGVKHIVTNSFRNNAQISIEIRDSFNVQNVMDEIKNRIDSISSFPENMEKPIVERVLRNQDVLYLSLHGDLSQHELKELGEKTLKEIQALPGIDNASLDNVLPYEISIEISKEKLRAYNLTFFDIANAVRNYSKNLSAGQIQTSNGYISIRAQNQAYEKREFENISLISRSDGSQVKIGDVAVIKDDFEDGIQYSKFDQENAVYLTVAATKDQDISTIAKTIHAYLDRKKAELPEEVKLEAWVDFTEYLDERLAMMLQNILYGALLVFIVLSLFLEIKMAFWVMMGLPVCFMGTFLLLPISAIDVTISLTSLFAFILVLGIVVDDAIVTAESVHTEIEAKGHTIENVITGVKRVAVPATFGVLTTIAAFTPMILDDGPSAAFSHSIGFVVVLCLLFSLLESKLILPSHLANISQRNSSTDGWHTRVRTKIDAWIKEFVNNSYRPLLKKSIRYRYTVLAGFISIVLISVGLIVNGAVKFSPAPKIAHDYPEIIIEMNQSASEVDTISAASIIEQLLLNIDLEVEQKYGKPMLLNISVKLESRTQANIMARLVHPELRAMDTFELAEQWRKAIPKIPGVKNIEIRAETFAGNREEGDVSFDLYGDDPSQLSRAVLELRARLKDIDGVISVNDSQSSLADEVRLTLKPQAYAMGLTLRDIASQVNFSFYGLEAQRLVRDTEEIRVMIRYPEQERNSTALISDTLIWTPEGMEVPLSEVVNVTLTSGVEKIRREDGKRNVNVWAGIDADKISSYSITEDINDSFLPELISRYPTVHLQIGTRMQEEKDGISTAMRNLLVTLMIIYGLLAIPLRSYTQPLIIMSVIPFGIIGAIFGHLLLGMTLSMLSVFGIIAVTGVVINDSLVMVDFVNREKTRGASLYEAIVDAGCHRFRAIMLTSLTTFVGVVPIMMETSLQAQIVVPMAVSLAFGVLFATVITLFLVPSLYSILEDLKKLLRLNRKSNDITTEGDTVLLQEAREPN